MEKKITCELRDKWVTNLLSGEYVQGHRHLKLNGRYCCLGVLCASAGVELTPDGQTGEILPSDEYRPFRGSATPTLNGEAFGIPQAQIELLWKMNDGCQSTIDAQVENVERTFPEIAEWIQENVECE